MDVWMGVFAFEPYRGARTVTQEIIIALIGVFGSALVAAVLYVLGVRESKTRATIEAQRDFNSYSMQVSRGEAFSFIRNHPRQDYRTIMSPDFVVESGQDGRAHLWAVLRFYEYLYGLKRANRLDERLAYELFSGPFLWWWHFSFSTQLSVTKWTVASQMLELRNWFAARSKAIDKGARLKAAIEGAAADRNLIDSAE